MSAASVPPPVDDTRPVVRMGQRWLYEGQDWIVQEVLSDGIIVLGGNDRRRQVCGVYADELYAAGRLQHEAPAPDKQVERLARAFEAAKAKAANDNGKPRRTPKPKPGPSFKPWRVNLLAVDTATNSGWSLWTLGKLIGYGEVRATDDARLLQLCREVHTLSDAPAVLVLESAPAIIYPGRGPRVMLGLGAARGAWLRAWRDANGVKRRVVSFKPARWRGAIIPKIVKTMSTPEREQQFALLTLREHFGACPESVRPDAAAALCIGRFAVYCGEVGLCLPPKLRELVA